MPWEDGITTVLWLDYETFGTVPLDKVGHYKYLQHPDTEPLLLSFAINDGPVELIDFTKPEYTWRKKLKSVLSRARRKTTVCVSHGAFDRIALRCLHGVDKPPSEWIDTMILALSANFPAALGKAGAAVGLPEDQQKLADGKKLIRRFCVPAPSNHKAYRYYPSTHPGEWERFCEYAVQDTASMRALYARIPHKNYRGWLRRLWIVDQAINDRGLAIDVELADACRAEGERLREELNAELSVLTDREVRKTSEVAKLRCWLGDRGIITDSLDKAAVEELLLEDDVQADEDAARALELRSLGNKASIAKYVAAITQADDLDGRIRGSLQAFQARTLRWGGRGIQPQNMPRQTMSPTVFLEMLGADMVDVGYGRDAMRALSEAIRSLIVAQPGWKLVWGDLSGIEARMLPWLARCQRLLDVFIEGRDPYIDAAAGIFRVPYDAVTKQQRFLGKVAVLALGYQGGWRAFRKMARNYSVDIPQAQAEEIVAGWREANPEIVEFWADLDTAARNAIKNHGATFTAGRIRFIANASALRMILPSGHTIYYHRPSIGNRKTPFGVERNVILFWGVDSYTKQWCQMSTYGGKMAENASQAASFDVLAYNMPAIDASGYNIVLTVHDEVVCEVPDTDDYTVEDLVAMLVRKPPFARDLPLKAAGKEGPRWSK